MMDTKLLNMAALAAISVGILATADNAFAAKEVFQRTKPTVPATAEIPTTRPSTQSTASGRNTEIGGGIKKPTADLVFKQPYANGSPVGAPMTGYCGGNQGAGASKTLVIPVRNNGNVATGAFKVRVTFKTAHPAHNVIEKTYNPLPAGGPGSPATLKAFDIPFTAWNNGQAAFEVEIDSGKQVNEGIGFGENNNKISKLCSQPAG